MFAILLNGLSICVGTLLGYFFKNYSSEKISKSIIVVIGLQMAVMGMKDGLQYENGMVNVIYLVVGVVIGEILDIDKRLNNLGELIQKKFAKGENDVVKGFVVATLVFCIGSMAVLGPLKISLENDNSIIYVKTILDGVMAMILASTYGIGVIFSALIVVGYQGGILVLADFLKVVTEPHVINQISSVGGVLLVGLAITLIFDVKYVKVTNMLPAMFLPIIIAIIRNF